MESGPPGLAGKGSMVHRPNENCQARGGFAIHRIVEQRPVAPDYKSGGSKGQFVKVFSP